MYIYIFFKFIFLYIYFFFIITKINYFEIKIITKLKKNSLI